MKELYNIFKHWERKLLISPSGRIVHASLYVIQAGQFPVVRCVHRSLSFIKALGSWSVDLTVVKVLTYLIITETSVLPLFQSHIHPHPAMVLHPRWPLSCLLSRYFVILRYFCNVAHIVCGDWLFNSAWCPNPFEKSVYILFCITLLSYMVWVSHFWLVFFFLYFCCCCLVRGMLWVGLIQRQFQIFACRFLNQRMFYFLG